MAPVTTRVRRPTGGGAGQHLPRGCAAKPDPNSPPSSDPSPGDSGIQPPGPALPSVLNHVVQPAGTSECYGLRMAAAGPAKRALFRTGLGLYGLALGIAARLPWKYPRFLALHARADRLVERRDGSRAAAFARELLELAESYRGDWNYGNAVHHGHLILGRVALLNGGIATARAELLLAGQTPGSPQLDSFGPNMRLAKELLEAGEKAIVLQYFDLCRRFWVMGTQNLAQWSAAINESRMPEFGPNLRY